LSPGCFTPSSGQRQWKSTLLSMLAGLDLPTEGEVTFDGRNLNDLDLDRYRRESIAMIFQAFQLFPLLTVLENVCYTRWSFAA
jgi:putative ABC transport system ATP-binding protein